MLRTLNFNVFFLLPSSTPSDSFLDPCHRDRYLRGNIVARDIEFMWRISIFGHPYKMQIQQNTKTFYKFHTTQKEGERKRTRALVTRIWKSNSFFLLVPFCKWWNAIIFYFSLKLMSKCDGYGFDTPVHLPKQRGSQTNRKEKKWERVHWKWHKWWRKSSIHCHKWWLHRTGYVKTWRNWCLHHNFVVVRAEAFITIFKNNNLSIVTIFSHPWIMMEKFCCSLLSSKEPKKSLFFSIRWFSSLLFIACAINALFIINAIKMRRAREREKFCNTFITIVERETCKRDTPFVAHLFTLFFSLHRKRKMMNEIHRIYNDIQKETRENGIVTIY